MSGVGGTVRRTARYVGSVVEELADMFVGSLTVISLIIAEAWSIFFVGVLGAVLVLLRNWFFENAGTLAHQSHTFTAIINFLIGAVVLLEDAVGLIISFIGGIASLFTGHPAFPKFTPQKFGFINSTSFEKACVELPRACADIDTPGELFELVLTPVASNATCGFFRYIYPVPWLFDTLYPPARALYLTYPPYPPLSGPPDEYGNNCACPPSSPCGYQWQCIVLGSGYWLLEFVLPLILLGAMWQGWIEHVLRIVAAVVLAVAGIGVRAVGIVLRAANRAARAVSTALGEIWAVGEGEGNGGAKRKPPPAVANPVFSTGKMGGGWDAEAGPDRTTEFSKLL